MLLIFLNGFCVWYALCLIVVLYKNVKQHLGFNTIGVFHYLNEYNYRKQPLIMH